MVRKLKYPHPNGINLATAAAPPPSRAASPAAAPPESRAASEPSPPVALVVRPDRVSFELVATARAATMSDVRTVLETWFAGVATRIPSGATVAMEDFEVLVDGAPDEADADNPERVLTLMLLDMQEQMIEAKKHVAVAIADEKRLGRQVEQERQLAIEWEKTALVSVKGANHELAQQATLRKDEHDRLALGYEEQWTAQKMAVDQLKEALVGLNSKVEEAKRKKSLLVARAKRAEAQKTIAETLDALSNTTAFETMARMEEAVARVEAEAQACYDLAKLTSTGAQHQAPDAPAAPDGGGASTLALVRDFREVREGKTLAEASSAQPLPPMPPASAVRLVPQADPVSAPRPMSARVRATVHVPLADGESFWDRAASLEEPAARSRRQAPPAFAARRGHRPSRLGRRRRGRRRHAPGSTRRAGQRRRRRPVQRRASVDVHSAALLGARLPRAPR